MCTLASEGEGSSYTPRIFLLASSSSSSVLSSPPEYKGGVFCLLLGHTGSHACKAACITKGGVLRVGKCEWMKENKTPWLSASCSRRSPPPSSPYGQTRENITSALLHVCSPFRRGKKKTYFCRSAAAPSSPPPPSPLSTSLSIHERERVQGEAAPLALTTALEVCTGDIQFKGCCELRLIPEITLYSSSHPSCAPPRVRVCVLTPCPVCPLLLASEPVCCEAAPCHRSSRLVRDLRRQAPLHARSGPGMPALRHPKQKQRCNAACEPRAYSSTTCARGTPARPRRTRESAAHT
jgi:hypothetical protein